MTFIFRNRTIFWDTQNGIEDKQSGTEGVVIVILTSSHVHCAFDEDFYFFGPIS